MENQRKGKRHPGASMDPGPPSLIIVQGEIRSFDKQLWCGLNTYKQTNKTNKQPSQFTLQSSEVPLLMTWLFPTTSGDLTEVVSLILKRWKKNNKNKRLMSCKIFQYFLVFPHSQPHQRSTDKKGQPQSPPTLWKALYPTNWLGFL